MTTHEQVAALKVEATYFWRDNLREEIKRLLSVALASVDKV